MEYNQELSFDGEYHLVYLETVSWFISCQNMLLYPGDGRSSGMEIPTMATTDTRP